MRGRSPLNKPEVRKYEVFKLLMRLGGQARWRDLEAEARKVQMGPGTLKRLLDLLIKEGVLQSSARLGPKGAEVWYELEKKWVNIFEVPPFDRLFRLWARMELAKEEGGEDWKDKWAQIIIQETPTWIAALVALPLFVLEQLVERKEKEEAFIVWDLFLQIILTEGYKPLFELVTLFPRECIQPVLKTLRHMILEPVKAASPPLNDDDYIMIQRALKKAALEGNVREIALNEIKNMLGRLSEG